MTKAYWVAHITVTNKKEYPQYLEAAATPLPIQTSSLSKALMGNAPTLLWESEQ